MERRDATVSIHPYGDLPTLHFHHDAREVIPHGDWWMRNQYPREAERGFDCEEDLFSPFALRFEHPELGRFDLEFTSFQVAEQQSLRLSLYTPADDGHSETTLRAVVAAQQDLASGA